MKIKIGEYEFEGSLEDLEQALIWIDDNGTRVADAVEHLALLGECVRRNLERARETP